MNLKKGIGKTGLALAALVAIAESVLCLLFNPVSINPVQYGLCLPSPDTWGFEPIGSWIINNLIIALVALLLFLVNKTYNFVRTTEPVLPALFLIMTTSSPLFTTAINTSVLLCMANVVCMGIIFDSYDSKNATREIFMIGVVIGFGSMVQYAFLPMAFVYLLWTLFMKVLRIKETLAFIAGILCPYWIALGTGWIGFDNFHFPSLSPLLDMNADPSEFFIFLSGIALAASLGFILSFVNSIKLYAGNSKVNAMNLCVSTLGAAAVVCILVDFDNMEAYVVTLYMACAIQIANICALWNPKMPWIVTVIPSLLYLGIFVCSIIF